MYPVDGLRNFCPTILITGAGAPGTAGTLAALKKDGFSCRTVGVDMDAQSPGRFLVDEFFVIPRPSDPGFIEAVSEIVRRCGANVLIPQVTMELEPLSACAELFARLGCTVLVNTPDNLNLLNNKYALLCTFRDSGFPVPRFFLVKTPEELRSYAEKLGYPEHRVVVKLPVSNGMRGLRILSGDIDRRTMFMGEKPGSPLETLDAFLDYFGDGSMPPLLLMEYLEGPEYSVDCLADNGEPILVLPRIRDRIRTGISFESTSVRHEQIIDICQKLIRCLNLSRMFGFQFRDNGDAVPMILESNPRIQGSMVLGAFCSANAIQGAVRLALGMDAGVSQDAVIWGSRLTRYWGGIITSASRFLGRF